MFIKYLIFIIGFIKCKLIDINKYIILSKIIKDNNYNNYLEIGIWKGKTLFNIAKRNKNIKIYGVDDFNYKNYKNYTHGEIMSKTNFDIFNKIKINTINKSKKFNNVKILLKNSVNASKKFNDNSLDMVFIDALHDYKNVCKDIKIWLPKIKKNGILSGHDFSLHHFSVIKAVGDMLGYDNITIKPNVSIWIYKK
jgi:hypothetical protein